MLRIPIAHTINQRFEIATIPEAPRILQITHSQYNKNSNWVMARTANEDIIIPSFIVLWIKAKLQRTEPGHSKALDC
jgi:hypothetical protein